MQTKTVKSVRENVRNFAGKNGTTYIHMITLDSPVNIEGTDVIEGEYHSTKPTCENFTAGKEATFETEKRVSPDGKYTNYKFKPVKAAPAFGGFSAGKKGGEYRDPGVLMYNHTLHAVMSGLAQSSLINDKNKIAEYVEFFYQEAKKKKGDSV